MRKTCISIVILLSIAFACSNEGSNSPPVASAGDDQTVTAGDTVQLDGSGSTDADGDEINYNWEIQSNPHVSTAQLSDSTIVNPVFITDIAGEYQVQLGVSDGIKDIMSCDEVVITAVE